MTPIHPTLDRIEPPRQTPAPDRGRRAWEPPAVSRVSVVDTTLKGFVGGDADLESS